MSSNQTDSHVPQNGNCSPANSTSTRILATKLGSYFGHQIREIPISEAELEVFTLRRGYDPNYTKDLKECAKPEGRSQEARRKVCPYYEEHTHVCKLDGTAWCPFPYAEFCGTRNEGKQD